MIWIRNTARVVLVTVALSGSLAGCGKRGDTSRDEAAAERDTARVPEADTSASESPENEASVVMDEETRRVNGVVIAAAGPAEIREEIDLPGEIVLDADRVAHIVPRFPGIVQEVRRSLGDRIAAGDVMAIVQSNVSAAPYEVQSLMPGVVIEKRVSLGEYVRDDQDIFVVADLSRVWVDISIYSRYLSSVKVGQRVRVTSAGVEESAEGRVGYLGPVLGESTRTGVARVVLENPRGVWQPGLFVIAHIAVDVRTVGVAVPDDAVQTLHGRSVVFVRDGDRFDVRTVTLGRRDPRRVEIVSGLVPGEEYVASGSFLFKAESSKSEAAEED